MHHQPNRQRVEHRGHPLGDMAQRQKRQRAVPQCCVQVAGGLPELEHHVAIRHHGTFGRPGGAGGIDQKSRVVWRTCGNGGVEVTGACGGECPAMGQQVVEENHLSVLQGAQAFAVHHHNTQQVGTRLTHRQCFFKLLLVLDQQHPGLRMLQDVGHLGARRSRVDAVPDHAHTLRAHIGNQPLRPVLGQHTNYLPACDPQVGQGQPDGACVFQVHRPGGAFPQAAALVAQGCTVSPVPAAGAEHFLGRVTAFKQDVVGHGAGWGHGDGIAGAQRQVLRRDQRWAVPLKVCVWPRPR